MRSGLVWAHLVYYHHQIYTYDTAHIEYGLYENIEASAVFEMYLHKTEASEHTEDKNMACMYNLGQPMSGGHITCAQAVRSEIYNEEQNEILQMNEENTNRIEKEKKQANENIMNIHNRSMDMSQKVPMILVYMPIVEEHHGEIFCEQLKITELKMFQICIDRYGKTRRRNYDT